MFELIIRQHFSAAHRLLNYQGKCANLHGHTWEVEAVVTGEHLDGRGMLRDFDDLKKALGKYLDQLDHSCLNELSPFNVGQGENNPTAENIAFYLYHELKRELAAGQPPVRVKKVTVWESPRAAASFGED